jgi:hypothetical protein
MRGTSGAETLIRDKSHLDFYGIVNGFDDWQVLYGPASAKE